MRILIVDDDQIALDVLTQALTQAGHEVVAVNNGPGALEFLREDSFRLVISDWEMPVMNGLELCRLIRAAVFPAYIYFILLTARDGTDNAVEGLSAGADDFLTKPLNSAELCVRVRAAERLLSLETRDVTIFAMAKLAESRDPETGAHLERVRSYSRLIACQLAQNEKFRAQIDAEFIRLIYLTSPLHDIGKVGIPDSVLLKPGRLSDREFEIMKSHTMIGADTLDAAVQRFPGVRFLEMAREIAMTHHERYDGSGYPAGLVGDEIPLSGRIVALADVYDALTSNRVYKKAYSHDVAYGIILPERGKHFDPVVVDAFFEIENEFIEVLNRFTELDLAAV